MLEYTVPILNPHRNYNDMNAVEALQIFACTVGTKNGAPNV